MPRSRTIDFPATIPGGVSRPEPATRLGRWLLRDRVPPSGAESVEGNTQTHSWWKVMCLTGVDYFSTLSYLPGIAVLAAGALSPLATLLIVALTLLGMLPMYRRVAKESPHGQGSVAMLERLLPFWQGKLFVLILLGFVATSWIITITLSSADATVHLLENPFFPRALSGQAVLITVVLLLTLGGVFLLGFTEAVNVAIPLVVAFLALNGIVITTGMIELFANPIVIGDWIAAITLGGGGWSGILVPALLAFPLLVLGLSGFETGVSMMPLVAAKGATAEERLASRIRNTKRLLTAAAVIMSAFLITSSLVTTILIPNAAFQPGGEANGRALAYLAHGLLGEVFGTAYDISSILILWFAGASAMAGLINIVPRYLPAYGMAPDWSRSVRPVVLVFTTISIILTIGFQASVDAQAGAYATGILAMMVSASFAVTISAYRKHQKVARVGFTILTLVMGYALVENIIEKPDGIAISMLFIVGIIVISLISRVTRTTELRASRIEFDAKAQEFIEYTVAFDGKINIIAHKVRRGLKSQFAAKEREQRVFVAAGADVIFLEVEIIDPSEFEEVLHIRGVEINGRRVLRTQSPAAPNAIAAVLLALRDGSGVVPSAFFQWSEGNPIRHLLEYLVLGRGDTAPVVREILREAEHDPKRRPSIHVS
ncbi:MAG: amino acid transporter [Salinibacterium sp.]|nr:amino acid transporter [Salinibacterium sp.]